MIFSSATFLFLFLPIVLVGVWILRSWRPETRATLYWLVASSIFFYAFWKLSYLPILLASILANWWIGERIRATRRRSTLAIGVALNLGLLGYFKYADFLIDNGNRLFGSDIEPLGILLPIGISFFTFQQIAYLADTAVGRTESTPLPAYAFFVSFFPQLIAGPIVHHRHILPYLRRPDAISITASSVLDGLLLFSIGLFKKVMIADRLSPAASSIFAAADAGASFDPAIALLGLLSFAFQIYFDFSGYSDMALGLARMVGIRLPANFLSPYKATSIIEFWRRWHITLSEFLRDYLYIPLGGNRKGRGRRYLNLFLTMLIGGLWHGASWNFVFWGGLHGALLMANHLARPLLARSAVLGSPRLVPLWFAATFCATTLAWVPFRASDPAATELFYRCLFALPTPGAAEALLGRLDPSTAWLGVAGAALIAFLTPGALELQARYEQAGEAGRVAYRSYAFVLCAIAAFTIAFVVNRTTEFIYFNF